MATRSIDPSGDANSIATIIAQTNVVERILNNIIAKHLGRDFDGRLEEYLQLSGHSDRTILNTKFVFAQMIEGEVLGGKSLCKQGKVEKYLKIRNDFAHNIVMRDDKFLLDSSPEDSDVIFSRYIEFHGLQEDIYSILLKIETAIDNRNR